MMLPHTAINLRERKRNKLKDFLVMAGPLGISQLMIFSQNEETGSTQLRFAVMPKGPTINFRIQEYSLCKDVARNQKLPKSVSKSGPEFLNPPLLVLSGFRNPKDADQHEKLVVTMFQNMFPPISPQNTKVGTIKRVLLLHRDNKTGLIELRHYVIDTKLVDVSKNVKKLVKVHQKTNKKLPDLSRVDDVADIILDPYAQAGFTSDSEVEDDAVVEVKEEVAVKAKGAAEESGKRKKAVKLTEIGPRLKLELVKIEEGVCSGKVLYHSRIQKSVKEMNKLDQVHAVRRKEKEKRRREQEENIKRKKQKKVKIDGEESDDSEELDVSDDYSDFE
ncbi:hypothetical protein OGAPHI_006004 [Ogataea philodendri]|uniref:Brix domain-containing protein n=1 Tax=Ogataea philodendri TaxID=1378263 RepID=A0A9P8NYZ4_9ASCO|nr:uncharacterized protein OGAPHI_006004 [Ogataea philodendri]KAH3661826.1 hypothetical protein OGAPHI_006004 [Ogataea philodendri]